jgi:predicted small metal-binding protein
MGKILCCNWVYPAGCDFVARGETEEEVLELAQSHAREHGVEATPELLALAKSYIEDD